MQIGKNLRIGISGLVLTVLSLGCNLPIIKYEYSEPIVKEGVVSESEYKKAYTTIGPKFDFDEGVKIGLIKVPEEYKVTLDVGEVSFLFSGRSDEVKGLYNNFTQDEHIQVSYREIFKLTYEDLDGDGKRELKSKELTEYDFIRALPLAEFDDSKPN